MIHIGVLGFVTQPYNSKEGYLKLLFGLRELEHSLHTTDYELVSGYVALGINSQAEQVAQRLHKPLTVVCNAAEIVPFIGVESQNFHLVGHQQGDECDFLIEFCNAFIRVGGDEQAIRVAKAARESGKLVIEYDLLSL